MIVRDEFGYVHEVVSITTEDSKHGACVVGMFPDRTTIKLTEYGTEQECNTLIDYAYTRAVKQCKGFPGMPFILDL